MKFEFLIKTKDGELWTQLQGNGGQHGNGCLHIDIDGMKPPDRQRLFERLLARVRRELEHEGRLRVWRGDDLPPAERIVPTEVLEVLEVRHERESG